MQTDDRCVNTHVHEDDIRIWQALRNAKSLWHAHCEIQEDVVDVPMPRPVLSIQITLVVIH